VIAMLGTRISPTDRDADEIIEWFVGDEVHSLDGIAFVEAVGRTLVTRGMPIHHLALHIRALHPTVAVRSIVWGPTAPAVLIDVKHGAEFSKWPPRGPFAHVTLTREWLTLRAGDQRWGPSDALFRGELTELCIAPVVHGGDAASTNVIIFGTREAQGFSDATLVLLRRILPALRSALELKIWRRRTVTILDTYIGADPERRIMSGHIHRGDIETLEAVIMFCDLHGFTRISNRLSSERVLSLLNSYFDQAVPSITECGGEILKFMGDGLLALFRIEGNANRSCAAALKAAQLIGQRLAGISQADAELKAGIGLHFGAISYGNIGSGQRLDFTAIGRDVNLASRIQGLCSQLSKPVLLSKRFSSSLLSGSFSMGRHALKGFDEFVEVFAPV
jgi:adenylate cyclase